jgi:hypothetical protein
LQRGADRSRDLEAPADPLALARLARAPENLTKPDKVALKAEPKTGTKRYIVEIDGEPWFVGSAWRALGYSNTSDAITRHCKGVVKYTTPFGPSASRCVPAARALILAALALAHHDLAPREIDVLPTQAQTLHQT